MTGVPPFMDEQPLLAVETAVIAGRRAARADDPMTRHDDGDRVGPVRQSDCTARPTSAELLS
jgi:hypothetical protein